MILRAGFVLVTLPLFACGQAASAPVDGASPRAAETAASATPSAPSAMPGAPGTASVVTEPSPPIPCGDFGGKIHGSSTCVHVSTSSWGVTPLANRVDHNASLGAACGDTVTWGGRRATFACAFTEHQASVAVSLRFEDGTVTALGAHDGFCDFVIGIYAPNGDGIDLTIDYVILD